MLWVHCGGRCALPLTHPLPLFFVSAPPPALFAHYKAVFRFCLSFCFSSFMFLRFLVSSFVESCFQVCLYSTQVPTDFVASQRHFRVA